MEVIIGLLVVQILVSVIWFADVALDLYRRTL